MALRFHPLAHRIAPLPMSDTTFDTIIIGGGTAGALLSNRLSASSRHRVLLIEAGRKDDYHWIHIPVGYLYCIGNPRTDWLYQTEPDAGLNGRTLRYPRGKTLGGCSSINGMIYMRGQARDYDQWAELTGDASGRWDNALPYFRRHEDHWRLDKPEGVNENFKRLHGNKATGSTGEWRVEKQRLRWDVLDAFAQAAQQAGIPATDDFNGGSNEGVGYFEVNQKAGWRWNTAKAFLRPTCYGRPNFEMWTAAQVTRLLFETQPALEKIVLLKPDIIFASRFRHQDIAPLMQKIAPVALLEDVFEFKKTLTVVAENLAIAAVDVLDEADLEWFREQGIRILPVTYREAMRDMGCNVLALGREQAISLGVPHGRYLQLYLALIAILVALSTSLVGPTAFMGVFVANIVYALVPQGMNIHL